MGGVKVVHLSSLESVTFVCKSQINQTIENEDKNKRKNLNKTT